MTSILSSISGHFGKALILGSFFPAALFVLLNGILLDPFVPDDWPPLQAVRSVDPQWRTLAVLGVTVLLAGLLYNLNTPIVRFYEGYPWKESWVGKILSRHQRAEYRDAKFRWAGVRVLADEVRDNAPADGRLIALEGMRNRLGLRVNGDFPLAEGSVLPTQLGNVIRSFEDYPFRQYGMAAITLWPRLAGVVDKEYATGIEDAKTSFDFTINVSALSATSAGVLLVTGLASPGALTRQGPIWIGQVAVLILSAFVFYRGSIGRARAWGATVRGAFDLYRGALLQRLGFAQMPQGILEERALWGAISRQMIYGDPPAHKMPALRYFGQETFANVTPVGVSVSIVRALKGARQGEATFLLHIKNTDATQTAARVMVTDTLPVGWAYLWGSARRSRGTVPVTGINPYEFDLGELRPGEETLLTYRAREFK
jgi:hypothetical protein